MTSAPRSRSGANCLEAIRTSGESSRLAGRLEIERRAHQHRAQRLGVKPIQQRAIEARDARRKSAITARQFGVDSRRLRQPHQSAGEARVVERRDEAVDRLDAGLAALFEAGDVRELQLEGAEVMTAAR